MAEMPEVPAPARRPARKPARAPRKPPLTVAAIIDAALEIVDTEGLEALSMRRVAQKLDTGAASLYAHVQNKEDLLDLVLDRVNGEVKLPPPDPDHWQEQLGGALRQIRDIYASHNDLAKANFGRIPTHPNSLVSMESMFALLKSAGLPDKVIAWSGDLLALYGTAAGFELGLLRLREMQDPGSVEAYFAQIGGFFGSLPQERFPAVHSLLEAMMEGDSDERFDFGLEVILLGMQAYADRMRAAEDAAESAPEG
ncbi:MAG: TetR/AcrR family transcriptional regulator [Streptomycetaceae bacterium]|nr:TetR/AcrR family transcriptional regulator [Streptomycetaceae bacterium]